MLAFAILGAKDRPTDRTMLHTQFGQNNIASSGTHQGLMFRVLQFRVYTLDLQKCAPKFIVSLKSTLESIHLCLCQVALTLWHHRRTEEVKEGVNSGASGWGLGLALGTGLLLLKLHDKTKHLPAAGTRGSSSQSICRGSHKIKQGDMCRTAETLQTESAAKQRKTTSQTQHKTGQTRGGHTQTGKANPDKVSGKTK